MTTVRALGFGDAEAWGVTWVPGEDTTISLAAAAGPAVGVVGGELHGAGEGGPWRIEANGTSLVFARSGPAGGDATPDGSLSSLDELCTVSGTMTLDGGAREVNSMGWRTTLKGNFDLDRIDSFRQTSAWFEPTHGFSLVAFRPRKARGHDADLVAAAVLEPETTARVGDPRLSTTYNAAGLPTRVGLELWLEESGDDDDETDRHYPRRAAGEVAGDGIEWELAGFNLHAAPLRWHSRGIDGEGVYLLGRRG